MVKNGHNIGAKNIPLPDEDELEDANDYLPGGGEDGLSVGGGKKDRKTSGEKSGKKLGKKSSGNPVIDHANKLMETTIDNMTEFAEYVRGAVLDPASQKALLKRLYDIAGDVLKDDDDGNGDDGDDDGNTGGTGGGAGSGDNDGDTDRGGTSGGGAGNGDDGSHGSAGGGDAASGDGNGGDDGAGGGDAASGDNGGDDGAGGGGASSGRIGGGEGSEDMGSVKRALDGKETGDAGGEATCGGDGEGHGSSMRKRQKVAVLKVPGLGSEAKAPANVPRGEALKGKGQEARGGGRKGKKAPTSAKFVEPEDDIMEDDLQGDEAMVGNGNDADDNIPTLRGLARDASV
jgi:hypothetical protein